HPIPEVDRYLGVARLHPHDRRGHRVDVQERAGRDEGVSVLSRSAVVDTKPRLREPCEEVRASYHQACGHVLFLERRPENRARAHHVGGEREVVHKMTTPSESLIPTACKSLAD